MDQDLTNTEPAFLTHQNDDPGGVAMTLNKDGAATKLTKSQKRKLVKARRKEQRSAKRRRTRMRKNGGSFSSSSMSQIIVQKALERKDNNVVIRHRQIKTAAELSSLDLKVLKNQETVSIDFSGISGFKWKCYSCKEICLQLHNEYTHCCKTCGDKMKENRYLTRDLTGQVALVTGARVKLGYQVALKLLRAGATVIATSREPDRAKLNYSQEFDHEQWKSKIHCCGIDFLTPNLGPEIDRLVDFIKNEFGHLDILVNNAAQTIRKPEIINNCEANHQKNRYGDPAHYPDGLTSSWMLKFDQVSLSEFEEVFRVNAIAPTMLISKLAALLMSRTPTRSYAYLVNVHAREGIFSVRKFSGHIHTNMAKAALAMLTNCLAQRGFKRCVRVHGVDPGWISIDEYCSNVDFYAPLDEIDGASKILYPIWKQLKTSSQTRRHYDELLY